MGRSGRAGIFSPMVVLIGPASRVERGSLSGKRIRQGLLEPVNRSSVRALRATKPENPVPAGKA